MFPNNAGLCRIVLFANLVLENPEGRLNALGATYSYRTSKHAEDSRMHLPESNGCCTSTSSELTALVSRPQRLRNNRLSRLREQTNNKRRVIFWAVWYILPVILCSTEKINAGVLLMYQIISSKCLKFGRFLKPLCQASTPSSKLVEWIIEVYHQSV
ncbi:unnamed protein product [Acanthoscelides obtectus]|uniref:Uncharacterized protein n=2 Tax=Acanthoscelides obtectus TaxID=200917 RepID=A0A9P0L4H6_ACAOB|nr:unnamed protein product [Acanthoscelides obtectus]CAK1630903.1 hypothetical protein AOBTE_LOCUS6628 [Acanthoscelides obtectus]